MTDKELIHRGKVFEKIYKIRQELDNIEDDMAGLPFNYYKNAWQRSARIQELVEDMDHSLEALRKMDQK